MGNVNSKSQDAFLNNLAMYETTASLGLCIVCWLYIPKALKILKLLNQDSGDEYRVKFKLIKNTFFYIRNLLFAIIIRCCGRYPSSPYSENAFTCVYQGFFENTGAYASFLLSLILALLLYYATNKSDKFDTPHEQRLIVKRFIKPKWWIIAIIYVISLFFSYIISSLTNFCHDHNANAIRKIHLVFYVPLIIICCVILCIFGCVWDDVSKKLNVNNACKLLFCNHNSDEVALSNSNSGLSARREFWRKIEKLVILNVLSFPLIMIICFTPGVIRKTIDYTEDETLFGWRFLHIAFQCIYGAIVATTCFYIIYYNLNLSIQTSRRINIYRMRSLSHVTSGSHRDFPVQTPLVGNKDNDIGNNNINCADDRNDNNTDLRSKRVKIKIEQPAGCNVSKIKNIGGCSADSVVLEDDGESASVHAPLKKIEQEKELSADPLNVSITLRKQSQRRNNKINLESGDSAQDQVKQTSAAPEGSNSNSGTGDNDMISCEATATRKSAAISSVVTTAATTTLKTVQMNSHDQANVTIYRTPSIDTTTVRTMDRDGGLVSVEISIPKHKDP